MKALLVAAFALGSTIAAAQVPDTLPNGCASLGLPRLHCGPAISLFELKPLSPEPTAFTPGFGAEADYHWQRWSLGAAIFFDGLQQLGHALIGGPSTEVSVAVFPCLGQSFGKLSGVCLGPKVSVPLPNPRSFTWREDFGLVLHASPDLIATLTSAVGL